MLAVMTLVFLFSWVPISLAKYKAYGRKWLASNREPLVGRELAPWGRRAERAQLNLKDNFPPFFVAIILLGVAGKFDELTMLASALYVIGRFGHYAAYVKGSVTIRFISYVLSLSCNVLLLLKIF
jgi:uncharacterized MAPEG superfamily protein